MSDLLFYIPFIVLVVPFYWPIKWIFQFIQFSNFIRAAEAAHASAYTSATADERERERGRFEQLVEQAVKSRNNYINNLDMAELLQGYIDLTVSISVEGRASDADEAKEWGERLTKNLQPMFSKPRIPRRSQTASGLSGQK